MSLAGSDGPNYGMLISRFSGSQQWERTLETAREWLAADPENPRAHFAAGQALINLDHHTEAQLHIEKVLAREPQNATAHRFMSIIHFHEKRFREADEEIQKAISLAPHDFYNWYHISSMFYQNGDLASAKKYAEKARAINPRSSAVLNMLAMCAPRDPGRSSQRLHQYLQALELNPENAVVHNNIGAHYLYVEQDFEMAEKYFRRALFFDPRLAIAKKNLFLTIKKRDNVYRILCLPKDALFGLLRESRRKGAFIYVLVFVPLWLLAGQFVIGLLLLWCVFVWPMVKVYEFLTVGDLRASAGELGARRGGVLNFRQWPLNLRLAIFGLCLLSFWSLVGWVIYSLQMSSPDAPLRPEDLLAWGGLAIVGAVVVSKIRTSIKRWESLSRAKARSRRLAGGLDKANMR